MRKIEPGIYRHFKGNLYLVLYIATHTETQEQMVVYRALYGELEVYVRPYDMFASEVDKAKYSDAEAHMTNEFPQRLQELRECQHKSRIVLSELCGLPPGAIRRYERGEIKPSIDSLIAIADYFHVSVDYLLGRTNY